jgi:hypothetical protein
VVRPLLAWVLFVSVAGAAPPRADVERILAGVERAPTRDDVERLQPGADEALIAVAADPKVSRLRRMRALYALRFAPSDAARRFAESVLALDVGRTASGADALDLAAALSALSPYGDALPTVLPFLAHVSGDVRQTAAALIGGWAPPSAEGILRARLTVERDPGVRLHLVEALRRISPPR